MVQVHSPQPHRKSMDNPPKVGEIIRGEAHRDAIHVAVAPMVAAHELQPGDHVSFIGLGDTNKMGRGDAPIGIVDPFLRNPVRAGETFYLFLYPGTITSLRHEWTHPVIQARKLFDPNKESIAWLTAAAEDFKLSFEEMMQAAKNHIEHGEWLTTGLETPDIDMDLFWMHYEKVTGERVKAKDKTTFFSCAC